MHVDYSEIRLYFRGFIIFDIFESGLESRECVESVLKKVKTIKYRKNVLLENFRIRLILEIISG